MANIVILGEREILTDFVGDITREMFGQLIVGGGRRHRHAERLTAPRGWHVRDRRDAVDRSPHLIAV